MFKKLIPYLSLFTSFTTLICCALPALLVTLGLGASLVSLLGNFPALIWFSEHKSLVFVVAGTLLLLNYVLRKKAARECPLDPELARACGKAREVSSIIFWCSLTLFLVGAFFAFGAPWIFL